MWIEVSQIQRNVWGLLWSCIIIALLVILIYVPAKPQFVVPNHQIVQRKRMSQRIVMRLICIGCVIYPLDLRIPIGVTTQQSNEQYVQVLLDISLSMAATDVAPSRFQVAKDVLNKVLQWLSGDSVSMITFSWIPVMIMPFSPHKEAVMQRIQHLSLSEFPPTNMFVWTALGDALLMWIDNLQQAASREERPGAILLVTDGDSSRGLDPYGLMDLVESIGVPVFALAIGSEDEIVGKDIEGNVVMAPLNPELLRQLAARTEGYFMHIQPGTQIDPFVENVKKSLQKTTFQHRVLRIIDINRWIVWIVLCGIVVQLGIWGIITYKKRQNGIFGLRL